MPHALADLSDTAATLKERIVKAAAAEQPLFQVTSHPLTFSSSSYRARICAELRWPTEAFMVQCF